MEWAQAGEILTSLFEEDIFADHPDDVRLLFHPVCEGSCFRHDYFLKELSNSSPGFHAPRTWMHVAALRLLVAQLHDRDGFSAAVRSFEMKISHQRMSGKKVSQAAAQRARAMSMYHPDPSVA